jgi:hypothetical protein
MLGRLVRTMGVAPTPTNVREGVDQLHALFEKNVASPSVQVDIKTIFG